MRVRAALEQADLHGGEEALADKIKIEQAEIQRLRQQLGEVASGVSPEVFEEGEDTGFDIAAELRELLAPLLREIRRATERPRAIDRLGREIERLTQELATAEQASKHVAETTASVVARTSHGFGPGGPAAGRTSVVNPAIRLSFSSGIRTLAGSRLAKLSIAIRMIFLAVSIASRS